MAAEILYADNIKPGGYYKVSFTVNASGERVIKDFDSEYMARNFVNKIRRSKRCTLISYPTFK